MVSWFISKTKEPFGEKLDHHYVFLFIDRCLTLLSWLSYFLTKKNGKDKLLLCEDIPRGNNYGAYMALTTENEIFDVVYRASYLAKTRSKLM